MNSTTHTPSNARPGAPGTGTASPTVRDESRLVRYIGIVLAVLVLAVLAFNMMAPKDRLRAPDEPVAPAATATTEQRQQPTTTAPGDGTVQRTVPERADSPTPIGREGMGAPAGALPSVQPPTQDMR